MIVLWFWYGDFVEFKFSFKVKIIDATQWTIIFSSQRSTTSSFICSRKTKKYCHYTFNHEGSTSSSGKFEWQVSKTFYCAFRDDRYLKLRFQGLSILLHLENVPDDLYWSVRHDCHQKLPLHHSPMLSMICMLLCFHLPTHFLQSTSLVHWIPVYHWTGFQSHSLLCLQKADDRLQFCVRKKFRRNRPRKHIQRSYIVSITKIFWNNTTLSKCKNDIWL